MKKILGKIFYQGSLYEGLKKYKIFRFLGINLRFRVKFCKNTRDFIKNHKPHPIDSLPDIKRKKVYISITAIFKNEPDIIEWINYHLLIGVERFYLYDNDSEPEYYELLKPYIEKDIIIYKKISGKCLQIPAYCDAVYRYKNETEWMAIIDIDEYIVPVKKNNIKDFLKNFEDAPAIVANWVLFDSNGVKERPQNKFVIETYTRRHKNISNDNNLATKSIVKPKEVRYVAIHNCFYKNNKIAVDENNNANITSLFFKTQKHSVNKIRINHYYCKSEEDYMLKIARGLADQKNLRSFDISVLNYENTENDYTIFKYLNKLRNFKLENYTSTTIK